MVFETTVHAKGRQVAVLQEIIRAEHQRRRARQLVGPHASRKMPRQKGRAGQRPITHGAQQQAASTGHRTLAGTNAGRHFTGAHALEAHGLVFDHQVQQHMLFGAEVADCLGPPSGEAVGIQGNAQALRHALLVQGRHLALQVTLQQTHLLHMVEQAPTDIGGRWRRGPYQHRLADARLQ